LVGCFNEYNLLIRVTDGGNPPLHGDVHVNVTLVDANDNQPQFVHTKYSVRVNESVPVGTSIAHVEATEVAFSAIFADWLEVVKNTKFIVAGFSLMFSTKTSILADAFIGSDPLSVA
jgi:hypothetical protein